MKTSFSQDAFPWFENKKTNKEENLSNYFRNALNMAVLNMCMPRILFLFFKTQTAEEFNYIHVAYSASFKSGDVCSLWSPKIFGLAH